MQVLRQQEYLLLQFTALFFEEAVDLVDAGPVDVGEPFSACSFLQDELMEVTFTVYIDGLELKWDLFLIVTDEDHMRRLVGRDLGCVFIEADGFALARQLVVVLVVRPVYSVISAGHTELSQNCSMRSVMREEGVSDPHDTDQGCLLPPLGHVLEIFQLLNDLWLP